MAQRREANKAMRRLSGKEGTGVYGLSQAEKNTMRSEGSAATQAQMAGLQAQLARQQVSPEATRAVAQVGMAANAQNEASIQQASNAAAQEEYNRDVSFVDNQAARGRQMWENQANISMQTTGAGQGNASQFKMWDTKKKLKETAGTPYDEQTAQAAALGMPTEGR